MKKLGLILICVLLLLVSACKKEGPEIINIDVPKNTASPTLNLATPVPTPTLIPVTFPTPVPTESAEIGLSGVVVGGSGSISSSAVSTVTPNPGSLITAKPTVTPGNVFVEPLLPSLVPILPPITVETPVPTQAPVEITPAATEAPPEETETPGPNLGDAVLDEDELPLIPAA